MQIADLLSSGQIMALGRGVRHRLSSTTTRIVLRRDLRQPFIPPEARVTLTVRPLQSAERQVFIGRARKTQDHDFKDRARMLRANLGTCYAAVDPRGEIAHVEWLMTPSDNEDIRAYFGDRFPILLPGEALLEGVYTLPSHRGVGVMSAAMAKIADEAKRRGARWAFAFVEENNKASLKGCRRAGLVPHQIRRDQWHLFRRTVTLEQVGDASRSL